MTPYPWEGHSPLCPFNLIPGRGTVPCARQFSRTARTRSLPIHHLGGARSSVPANPCGRRGRRPSRAVRQTPHPLCVLCVSVMEPKTCVRPPIVADREDAVPPHPPPGRGTVLCARLPFFSSFAADASPFLGGAQSSVPVYLIPGRGTVLRAGSFLRTAGTPSLPCCSRNTAPLCVLCVSVVQPKTCVRPPILAGGQDAFPAGLGRLPRWVRVGGNLPAGLAVA
jgi:hypothetical protein